MNMVYVPAGSFAMGSENEYNGEKPVHEVTLDGFWIDQTEVTNSQYTAFLNEMGNQEEGGVTWLYMDAVDSQIEEENGVFVSQTDYAEYPVNNVNWYGAAAYCDWVDGRLPSEAQWEYAARGPQSLNYPWGDDFDGRRANYCDKNCTYDIMDDSYDDGYTAAAPVGSFEDGASWVGALDMAGNVWEWINDWYDDSYYANSAQDNPQGPANGVSKVLRGGSWRHGLVSLRGAYRSPSDPATHYNKFGFRCALPGS